MVEEQLTQRGITNTEETCTYEELSHTADVGIRLQANSPAALFACAGQAMFKLAGAVVDDDSLATPPFVTVESGDAESLMVAWLNELLYQHEVNRRVPARVYASRKLLEQALTDKSIEQLVNSTTLPGIVGYAIAMPDVHQGYGFPVGGVAATALPDGVISPGAIGYDVNCGVRLLASELDVEDVEPYLDELATTLYNTCPSGVGRGGRYRLSPDELDEVLATGARWCRKNGLATDDDLIHTEASGCIEGANPEPPNIGRSGTPKFRQSPGEQRSSLSLTPGLRRGAQHRQSGSARH